MIERESKIIFWTGAKGRIPVSVSRVAFRTRQILKIEQKNFCSIVNQTSAVFWDTCVIICLTNLNIFLAKLLFWVFEKFIQIICRSDKMA